MTFLSSLTRILPAVLLALLVTAGPCLAEEDFWRKTSMDGVEIWYQDHNPEANTPLLFIHGWSCDSSVWKYQIPAFDQKYRVIVIDLPGFGRSGKPQDIAYSMNFFAKAVKQVMDDASASAPILIGHSMGCTVIRQYLTDYPGTVRAVCNADGVYMRIPEDPQALDSMKAAMAELIADMTGPEREHTLRAFIENTFHANTSPDIRKEIVSLMSSADVYAANSSFKEALTIEQWEHRSFALPVLTIHADNPYLPEDEEAYQRRIFPQLTYVLWNDCGHFIMLEKTARFNTILRNFIQDLR